MKRYISISLLVAALLLLGACSKETTQSADTKKDLTFISNFPSETLDPHLNFTTLRAGIAETLLKVNEEQEIVPWIAESWKTDDNGLSWTFIIKEGVTFHNGEKVDAKAVKESLERNIEVSEAIKASLKIKSMKADKQTLTVKLENPLPQFPSELVHPNTAIVDSATENMEQKPVGTGPFKVKSFAPNSKLVLEKNKDYWDGKPKLDEVTLTFNEDENARTAALQSGEADVAYRPALESLESLKSGSFKTDIVTGLRDQFLMFNFNEPLFQDLNVRKAFNLLLDRTEVAEQTLAGLAAPAEGPFVPDSPFSPDYEEKTFSIEGAKDELKKAGFQWKNGTAYQDGKPVEMKLLTYSYRPELPLMAQLLQANAKELGIKIDIQLAENIDEYMAEKEDWDLATYSMISDPRGDAAYFLNAVYMDGGAMHHSSIKQDELTGKIQQLNETVDEKQRDALAQEAAAIIDREVLHSFIVNPENFVSYTDRVLNWQTSKSEYYVITKDLDVKAK
ncbi:ABC transporter substrate-binding protein [Bacillus mangrovi]|uniref:ABC transporter substrate-binding protein n=1 Tax=Metabacillus mangrovi TaxID=1491830 RepID=A0A7X2S6K0_9BACI|nr:nickel ABC transporter substrate-binding protein [Metabacillus mangrovi]MTH54425.1 ABC transporter substrate-binding protein [Metabacillus mangrovi]